MRDWFKPKGQNKTIRNERLKLQATFLNSIGIAFVVVGMIGPSASLLWKIAPLPLWWQLVLAFCLPVLFGFYFHLGAIFILNSLEE